MRRMRASWSSWIWDEAAAAMSLLGGRGVGEVVPGLEPEVPLGSGGRGIAGGGDGREAAELLLRTWPVLGLAALLLLVSELERCGLSVEWMPSAEAMPSYLAYQS